jgi:hypothetical protein
VSRPAIAVPQNMGPRAPRVMARKKFLRLLRLMRYVREAQMVARFFCPRCQGPVALHRGSGLIDTAGVGGAVNPKKDTFSLKCACTSWTVGK